MAARQGYWDVHRCAWVDAGPADLGLPITGTATAEPSPPAGDATVPEQRPDLDAPLAAGTPD